MKTLLLILSLVLISSTTMAETGAMLRLFHTPSERATLDKLREGVEVSTKQPGEGGVKLYVPPPIKVNGLVKRENTEDVVWVNNQSTLKSSTIDDEIKIVPRAHNNNKIAVRVPGKGTVKLKPGQVYLPDEKIIVEAYEKQSTSKPILSNPIEDATDK